MGLGLHLVHKIVTEHCGTIHYSYEAPDVIFTVAIPLAAPAAPTEIAPTAFANGNRVK
ncbi:hypothetical protein IP91_04108 [Pseudoduganella lurida]|uniref:Histidine kinase/HSP90-like ATPase domain-containing protein n=1 Tax=Pseudoduganella lurida TaxID=1036180 RepID=A0A562R0M6_9BURK|nr:hypothetical protein [Pseudoduganella lurida]TWI62587.1 hypothetical protein IP91_04108 [Pseudoduganella lurida]